MSHSLNKMISVLVADDHPLMREGLCQVIAHQDDMMLIGTAANGKEAVSAFSQHNPDITIMDVAMPDLDGIAALRKIRKLNARAHVIMLSTYKYDTQILAAIQSGAKGFLLKTAVRHDLLSAVRDVHRGLNFISKEIAIQLALNIGNVPTSRRETEVLHYISIGHTNKEIAGILSLSEETVKAHVKNLLAKLGANDRTHAVTIAMRRGILLSSPFTRKD